MKLAIAAVSLCLSIAAPAFACPESHESRTAEKAKADDAKETAKADKAKPAGDKVSQR